MKNFISIDFEYNSTAEKRLNLVCCSMLFVNENRVEEYWLYNEDYTPLKNRIKELRDSHIFVAFNVVAEAHSFISLGIDPTKCKWLDIQAEYKMLLNHNHKYMYGKQLINGVEKFTSPPKNKWSQTEEERKWANNSKPQKSLAACTYKILGIKIDTDHKNTMRDIIISNDNNKIQFYKKEIMEYCTSDVPHLVPIWEKMKIAYREHLKKEYMVTFEEVLYRGETGARTALMTSLGYPIDKNAVKNFADSVPEINKEMCEDINSQFTKDRQPFLWNNKQQRFSKRVKMWKQWIEESEYAEKWMRTDKNDFSCSLNAFEKMFSYRHDFPQGNFFAQVMRYLKTQRSFNGFLPKTVNAKNKETFFDSVGTDERVRSWLNPYGAQSSRFQPKATSFLPLKSAWMRSMITPQSGRAICGMDYGSQEFLIAALVSKDLNMVDAYRSGDVYLYFAKLAGAVPKDGTKEEFPNERNLFKSTVLGISYNMGEEGLSKKLTADMGRVVTVQEAEDLIWKFENAFPNYAKWIDNVRHTYNYHSNCLKLPDGWIMFGDNDNKRSVSNMPIQGVGGSILRKAVQLSQINKLNVIFPLHDALYIEYSSQNLASIDLLKTSMINAFIYNFDDDMKDLASIIRLDANIWSPDYEDATVFTPEGLEVKQQKIYIDERSRAEYNRFKKYLRR